MKDLVLHGGDGTETTLPFKWAICGQCDGHGKSSAYLGAFTREEAEAEARKLMASMNGPNSRATFRYTAWAR